MRPPHDPMAWDEAQKATRLCANPLYYFTAAVVVIGLLLAVFGAGYLVGSGRSGRCKGEARYLLPQSKKAMTPAPSASETPVFCATLGMTLMDAMQMGIDETIKQLEPVIRDYERLTADLMRDLEAERQWSHALSFKAADWLQGSQDPQAAYDILWCAVGHATPIDSCIEMLVAGRGVGGP